MSLKLMALVVVHLMIFLLGKSFNSGCHGQPSSAANAFAAAMVSSDGVSLSVYCVVSSIEPPARSSLPKIAFFILAVGGLSSNAPKRVLSLCSNVDDNLPSAGIKAASSRFSQVMSSSSLQLLVAHAAMIASMHSVWFPGLQFSRRGLI